MNIWNEICRQVLVLKTRNAPESDLQSFFETVFVELGWSRLGGELIAQQEIPIGAANRLIPDIIIKSGERYLFVVELKQPNKGATDRVGSQLRSYMLQLKLTFGIYIGENIQVYYDDPSDGDQPQSIVRIPYETENPDGKELFELLQKAHYTDDTMKAFCQKKIAERQDSLEADKIISELVAGTSDIVLPNLLSKALNEKHSPSIANLVIKEIAISIGRKKQPYLPPDTSWLPIPDNDGEKIGRRAKNAFCRLLTENRLSIEELNQLCDQDFSKMTFGMSSYSILREILPGEKPEERRKGNDGRNRYYKEVYSSQGKRFVVCSQWIKNQSAQLENWLNQKGL